MKKRIWLCAIALACSATAMANDIAFYVGAPNTDGWYTVDAVAADVETIISLAGHQFKDVQQFNDDQFDAFGAWVDENMNDEEMDIIWLNGCMPSVLYPNPNTQPDGSRAEAWLDAGNMFINVGDWFAYCTYEGGARGADNGSAGAANILDLNAGVIISADGSSFPVTAAGAEYLPSLNDPAPSSRPIGLAAVVEPWEVAEVFAGNAAGTQGDPVVIHNTETGAYVAFVNQGGTGSWIDDRGLTCAEFINNWVANVIGLSDKSLAGDPEPEDEASDIPRDVVLSWQPGEYAVTHDVYFGTVFDDVNTASRSNPLDVLLSQGQAETTFDPPELLDFGTTYYWRIDEVNGAPDNTIYKGLVWSFTAEPFSYPIANVTATSNAVSEVKAGPENTVNGSGLNADDQHSVASGDMWLGKPVEGEPIWIQFEFDGIYKLDKMRVWNYNEQFELILGFGLKDVTVEYSADGADWTTLGDAQLNQATAKSTYVANSTVDFGGVGAKYVRLNVNSGWGTMGQYGLAEVRFLYIPAQAREPEPADGAADVSVDTGLAWRAGRDAVSHDVYFGTDAEALALADSVAGTEYTPGELNLDTTYYWQLDAVQETESWVGPVWSFATQEYLVVDDFESYNDDVDAATTIFDTWADGWINETGSTVGYFQAPFAEQSIVHGGRQSMPLAYDNTGVSTSEADIELSDDWSTNGIQSLSLHFYGAEGNTGQLYVRINNTEVDYDGPAVNLARPSWQLWSIDLSAVGNVRNVNSLTIGIRGAGASGILYIDDIRLYPEVLDYSSPEITGAGDTVQGVPNDGDWPAAEHPALAIDDNVNTKYLHRKGGAMATGFQVAPLVGSSVVTGLTFTTANDAPTRDPITFELSGSNASIDGPYTRIAAGDIVDFAGATEWPRFTKTTTPIEFENTTAYQYYQILFPDLRGSSETLMQIAEVEFLGTVAP